MTDAFENSPYKGEIRCVHLAIADVVNDTYDNQCWLRTSELATKARCDERTVRRARALMIEDGILIEIDRAGGRGKGAVFQYVFGGTKDGQNVRVFEEKPGQPEHETRTMSDSSLSTQHKELNAREFDDDFFVAWSVYPRKVNRKGALEKYRARRREGIPAEELLRATKHYAEAMGRERREEKHILHGATFYGPNE